MNRDTQTHTLHRIPFPALYSDHNRSVQSQETMVATTMGIPVDLYFTLAHFSICCCRSIFVYKCNIKRTHISAFVGGGAHTIWVFSSPANISHWDRSGELNARKQQWRRFFYFYFSFLLFSSILYFVQWKYAVICCGKYPFIHLNSLAAHYFSSMLFWFFYLFVSPLAIAFCWL